jgi:uncharacterized RDD family membrane protein YckC
MKNRRYDLGTIAHAELGGFWIRVLATLIDATVLLIPVTLLEALILGPSGAERGFRIEQALLTYSVWAVYCILFWSGPWHATPGKRLCGLTVLSSNGEDVTFWRSVVRYLSAVLSGAIIIGPLLVAFTERRQGLHDLLAQTIVVRRSALAKAAI